MQVFLMCDVIENRDLCQDEQFYLKTEADARITQLNLQLIEQGGELGKCQENRNKNMETIRRYEARIAELEGSIRAMHAADDAYGCGFYSDDAWRGHYQRLRELVGMKKREL